MIYPEKLRKGDLVALVCPSSPVTKKQEEAAVRLLTGMGYRVKTAGNLTKKYGGYMAGDAKERAWWVNRMFADPEVKAIFCMRGGDGITRSAEFFDRELIRNNPKIFVGYSDISILHLIINQECGIISFHGPMVASNMLSGLAPDELRALNACLSGEEPYAFRNPRGYRIGVMKEGRAEGILTGGNLSLISVSIGTPYEIDTKDKIVFIEETIDHVHRVGKMAMQMRNAGKFDQCAGILLGQFTDVENPYDRRYDALACLRDVFEGLSVPVMTNLQSGHGKKIITLPLGARCRMDTEDRSIQFDRPDRISSEA